MVELEQPMFGANYIKGKVRAQPNGGWVGEVKFKLHFKHGGAIEYGQAMLQAAGLTKRNQSYTDEPPAYQPPAGPWHDAAPPTYSPPAGYYGWVPPPSNAFANAPPDAKAAEAAASGTAYYDPNTHYAYVPPAYSNEAPPSYEESKDKKYK
uniref:EOG090X0ADZ n=1 Tax=Daphnia atkinsoni TaxID=342845 RepID=A0A4Y7M1S8_9CRUS|nr:EOG090X0ADZ [Daphnia atkinsoni]